MASYHREIQKWLGILFDKLFLEGAYEPKRLGLTLTEAYLLSKFPDGISVTEFTRFYRIKRSDALSTLEKLIRAGYVEKIQDRKDLRRRKLFLTRKGEETRELIRQEIEEKSEFVLAGLSHNEEVGILKFISKINQLTVEKHKVNDKKLK